MSYQWKNYSLSQVSDNVFRIIALLVLSFIIQFVASTFFNSHLEILQTLSLQFNESFNFLQILSHPFLHASTSLPWGLIELVFISLILYFFGSELEKVWGSHNFLKFFLFGILGGMILGLSVSFISIKNYYYFGISGGNAAIMTAYAILWPDRKMLFMFFIPMKMKWFIILIFILLAFWGKASSLIQYSGGAIAAACFLYYYARKANKSPIYPTGSLKKIKLSLKEKWQNYNHKKAMHAKRVELENRIERKEEVDRLLDKISKNGINSLTRKEKKFLDIASKEF